MNTDDIQLKDISHKIIQLLYDELKPTTANVFYPTEATQVDKEEKYIKKGEKHEKSHSK